MTLWTKIGDLLLLLLDLKRPTGELYQATCTMSQAAEDCLSPNNQNVLIWFMRYERGQTIRKLGVFHFY